MVDTPVEPIPSAGSTFDYRSVLRQMLEQNASDLHLKVGCSPTLRVNGDLRNLPMPPMRSDDMKTLADQIMPARRQKEFAERSQVFMDALDVDEVIAQLLVTEGFASVEEVAYVDLSEIAHIEGFDENTASEIQTRAREYLEKLEAERDARRRELGVSDDLLKVEGVTTAMLVAFGENGIKTVEDLADCATDDLVGWTERSKDKEVEPVRHKGVLDGFEVDRKDAEALILAARVVAGWITPDEAPASEEDEDSAAEGSEASEPASEA